MPQASFSPTDNLTCPIHVDLLSTTFEREANALPNPPLLTDHQKELVKAVLEQHATEITKAIFDTHEELTNNLNHSKLQVRTRLILL